MKINFDVDIDLGDRSELLEHIDYVSARANGNKNKKHQSGIYLQPIPVDPILGVSTINFDKAEEMGYFKVDVLNNSVYSNIETEEEMQELMNTEPMWEFLMYDEILENVPQLRGHGPLLRKYAPTSVSELSVVIALIRPGKKHLVGKSYAEIGDAIWQKPDDGEYHFKKSHSVAYAMSIVVALNKLTKDAKSSS